VTSVHDPDQETAFGALAEFGQQAYNCFTARADVLFELTDAVLCTEGPVRSLVGLSPATAVDQSAAHRRDPLAGAGRHTLA
jgi:hypothetical protein